MGVFEELIANAREDELETNLGNSPSTGYNISDLTKLSNGKGGANVWRFSRNQVLKDYTFRVADGDNSGLNYLPVACEVLSPSFFTVSSHEQTIFQCERDILRSALVEEAVLDVRGELGRAGYMRRGESLSRVHERPFVYGRSLPEYLRANLSEEKNKHLLDQRRTKLSAGEILDIADTVADDLNLLHEKGIVHRDVNGKNVIVRRGKNRVLNARLVDYGIAVVSNENELPQHFSEGEREMVLLLDEAIAGTLPNIAPEQIDGSLTKAVDYFQFAFLLYGLCTGHSLFVGYSIDMDTHQRVQYVVQFAREYLHNEDQFSERFVLGCSGRVPQNVISKASTLLRSSQSTRDFAGMHLEIKKYRKLLGRTT